MIVRWQDGVAHLESEPAGATDRGAILVAHSSSVVGKVIALQLEEWGYTTRRASTVAAAQEAFAAVPHEVVLSELALPGGGAVGLLRDIRALTPEVPVILLTGEAVERELILALRQGAFDYVVLHEIAVFRQVVEGLAPEPERADPLQGAVRRAVEHLRMLRRGRELSSALDKTQAELVRAEKAAGLSLASHGVANAIKNPLAVIRTNFATLRDWARAALRLEATRKVPGSGDVPPIIEDIDSAILRIADTIDEMLVLAHVGEQHLEPVPLAPLVTTLAEQLDEDLRHHAQLSISCDLSEAVQAHEENLRKVLLGILHNAFEACAATAKRGHVQLRVSRVGDRAHVEIVDDGEGMSETAVGKAFDPFYTTRLERNARGLGLTLARELLVHMGGSVSLRSLPGRGTTATVELALLPA